MLTLVKQKHECACVVACIATITGLSYEKCLNIVYPKRKINTWNLVGTWMKDQFKAMDRLNLKYRFRKNNTSLLKLKHNAILIIKHPIYFDRFKRGTHAVVWDAEAKKILDPYPSNSRHMKRNLPFKSYQKSIIEVSEIFN